MGILDGKAVVVTGAGDGLGRAYALDAAAQGARVVVNDINDASAQHVVAEITEQGGTATACAGSVASWADAGNVIASCVSTFGSLDGLVNNAGVIRTSEPWLADEAGIRAVIETNLMGALFVGVHALKVMVAQGSGSIVNNTSSAQLGLPGMGAYGASKGGLASLTYSWALDLRTHGIRVNAYSPVALTAMVDVSPLQAQDFPTTVDNASVVSYLLSDLAADITGQVVQRRGDSLVVMRHPDLTEHCATATPWTAEAIQEELAPVLRAGLQPVGDPRVRAVV